MSTTETEQETPRVIQRTFAAEVSAGDGRTVDVRIVPYGERIIHNDGLGGVPRGVEYEEEWLPGAFGHQVNAAHRVVANYEHEEGILGIVGKGIAFREAADGFYGSFKLLATQAGDTMLELLRENAVDGVSCEAIPVKNIRSGRLVQRAKANLRAIAFTRFAAYEGARVLALREEMETTLDAALLPVDPDPEMIERCRRLGLKLPQRYRAHPAQDTPDSSGTSEDGTRQTIGKHASSEVPEHEHDHTE